MKQVNIKGAIYNVADDWNGLGDLDRETRLSCLRVAADVAKMGLSHDVFATAGRYFKFVTGQPVEDATTGMSFEQRLEALIQEFLRGEIEDAHKIKHSIEEVYNRLEARYPSFTQEHPDELKHELGDAPWPATPEDLAQTFRDVEDKIVQPVTDYFESIRMQHKDIRA